MISAGDIFTLLVTLYNELLDEIGNEITSVIKKKVRLGYHNPFCS